jgi:hypothetical protein
MPKRRSPQWRVFYLMEIFSMQRDKRFRAVEDWALASDGVQWVLQRQSGPGNWQAVSFVRSSKAALVRCMREKGAPPHVAEQLLEGLPADFEAWHEQFYRLGHLPTASPAKIVMKGPGHQNKGGQEAIAA